jgi:DNA mismatch repair protein MutL
MQLTLSPDLIDVNVHPQKKEVRFKEESYLKDMLRQSVARSLQKKHTPMTVANFKGFCQEKDSFFYSSVQKESQDVKPLWSEEVKESLETLLQPPKQNVGMLPWEVDIVPKLQDLHFIGMYRHYALIEGNGSEGIFSLPDQQPPYTGLLMVDLKACTTRIYFDQVMHEQKEGNSLEKQLLLFPVTIHVAPSEASLLQESLQDIEALGISIRSFGTCSFVIDACLPSLDEEGIQELIYECIEDLKIQRASSREIRKKLALKAARIAGVANKRYDVEEAKKILSHLLKTETPYFCPFGKKTIAYISVHSYEKFFIKDSH